MELKGGEETRNTLVTELWKDTTKSLSAEVASRLEVRTTRHFRLAC